MSIVIDYYIIVINEHLGQYSIVTDTNFREFANPVDLNKVRTIK